MNNDLNCIFKKNNGYVTNRDFINAGMNKNDVKKLLNAKKIKKASHGLYLRYELDIDELFLINFKYPLAVISFSSALYLHNLTNRVPNEHHITVPRNKRVRGMYIVHRLSDKNYHIGIEKIQTPHGNEVLVYNAERCICDMVKYPNSFDLEEQNRILTYYFNSDIKNIDRLLEYSEQFNIFEKINTIVEVMLKW